MVNTDMLSILFNKHQTSDDETNVYIIAPLVS